VTVLLAHYDVVDLDRFLSVFDGFERARREHGSTDHWVLSDPDAPERVIALIRFGSRAEAEGFAADPERERALEEAGVVRREDEILEVVRPASPS
jgi:hypothetical protein